MTEKQFKLRLKVVAISFFAIGSLIGFVTALIIGTASVVNFAGEPIPVSVADNLKTNFKNTRWILSPKTECIVYDYDNLKKYISDIDAITQQQLDSLKTEDTCYKRAISVYFGRSPRNPLFGKKDATGRESVLLPRNYTTALLPAFYCEKDTNINAMHPKCVVLDTSKFVSAFDIYNTIPQRSKEIAYDLGHTYP